MGRIKSIDNALGINIHVTKEFVNIDGKKTIIGQLTNWIGTRSNINWVMLEMYTINDIASYVFCFSEDEAISIAYGIKFNDADYEISIDWLMSLLVGIITIAPTTISKLVHCAATCTMRLSMSIT